MKLMAESAVIRTAIEVARVHDLMQSTLNPEFINEMIPRLEIALDDLCDAVQGYLRGL
jgi:hypothetical protein